MKKQSQGASDGPERPWLISNIDVMMKTAVLALLTATALGAAESPQAQWSEMGLPFDSTLRFRMSVSGYGIIPNGSIALQLPSGFFWQVPRKKEGGYYLSAVFSSIPAKEERRCAWKGTLVLPAVTLPPRTQ